MKVGNFNIQDYLNKLHENEESDGGTENELGIVLPEENKKSFDWLKKEFEKGKIEVKVEMSSHKFEPGYSTKGAEDFKPGMYGQVKTSENTVSKEYKPSKFPETKFPGTSGETNKEDGGKKQEESSEEDTKKDSKEKSKPKVSFKTAKKKKKEEKEEKEEE